MEQSQRVKSLINKCGGAAKVATALDISPGTIYGWVYKTGEVPRKYWETLYKLSAMQVSLEELAGWGKYS